MGSAAFSPALPPPPDPTPLFGGRRGAPKKKKDIPEGRRAGGGGAGRAGDAGGAGGPAKPGGDKGGAPGVGVGGQDTTPASQSARPPGCPLPPPPPPGAQNPAKGSRRPQRDFTGSPISGLDPGAGEGVGHRREERRPRLERDRNTCEGTMTTISFLLHPPPAGGGSLSVRAGGKSLRPKQRSPASPGELQLADLRLGQGRRKEEIRGGGGKKRNSPAPRCRLPGNLKAR